MFDGAAASLPSRGFFFRWFCNLSTWQHIRTTVWAEFSDKLKVGKISEDSYAAHPQPITIHHWVQAFLCTMPSRKGKTGLVVVWADPLGREKGGEALGVTFSQRAHHLI